MTVTNWFALLRAGVQQLGLKPAEFWALTPAELMLMLGHGAGTVPLKRDGLNALLQAYPDERIKDD